MKLGCDYEALEEYGKDLKVALDEITDAINDITNYFNNMMKLWDSPTKDYFQKYYDAIKNNFGVIYDQEENINQYIANVVNNYRSF